MKQAPMNIKPIAYLQHPFHRLRFQTAAKNPFHKKSLEKTYAMAAS